jgi:hypothetical protein
LFRRRVRVDRKSGAVKILGQVFEAQKHDERYNVRDGENLLEALGSVRFEELPDDSFSGSHLGYLRGSRPWEDR